MCGIAGVFGLQPDEQVLAMLAAALAHRGPDGAGSFRAGDTALVHTRLAIIDLATGDQPLISGPLALIANGEIYNYVELRRDYPAAYATASDCEPPLKIFARDAENFTDALRGMFAIALHDAGPGTLTLARDAFGIKPLYICETASGIAFASEPQALLAAGFLPRAMDREKLHELLNVQFTTGTRTIFPGISRLLPGEVLTLRNGAVSSRKTLPFPAPEPPPADEQAALARLGQVLENAVELHQRADVPYGMFLSGGIDSATILTLMARLNVHPVLAFTAGFDVKGAADEREAAAAIAASLGARHARVEIDQNMVFAHLPEIVAAMDDPAADYAIIPSWFLARRARQEVKVILSGEGGDEMFAGYGRYRAASRRFFPKPMRGRGVFDGLGVLRAHGAKPAAREKFPGSRLAAARREDIANWLPNDLLLKLDRCLMAHGVEGRTPFIDREVAAFAFSLPDDLLVRNGQGKYLLRRWLERNCKAAKPFARKQGFDVPIGAWIASESRALGELVARQPVIQEITRPGTVPELFARAGEKRAGFAAWVLLFTALWHRRHVLGLPPAGDVFETLRAL